MKNGILLRPTIDSIVFDLYLNKTNQGQKLYIYMFKLIHEHLFHLF